jgi:hypothetical protein
VRGDFDGDGMADLTVYRPHTASWHTIGIKSGQPLPTVNHRVARDRANISVQPAAQPIAAAARPSDMFMGSVYARPARGLAHYSLSL